MSEQSEDKTGSSVSPPDDEYEKCSKFFTDCHEINSCGVKSVCYPQFFIAPL